MITVSEDDKHLQIILRGVEGFEGFEGSILNQYEGINC